MPIVGYIANSAYGAPTPFFGCSSCRRSSRRTSALDATVRHPPLRSGWLLMILVLIHVSAALSHHFIRDDNVMRRMLLRARWAVRRGRTIRGPAHSAAAPERCMLRQRIGASSSRCSWCGRLAARRRARSSRRCRPSAHWSFGDTDPEQSGGCSAGLRGSGITSRGKAFDSSFDRREGRCSGTLAR